MVVFCPENEKILKTKLDKSRENWRKCRFKDVLLCSYTNGFLLEFMVELALNNLFDRL